MFLAISIKEWRSDMKDKPKKLCKLVKKDALEDDLEGYKKLVNKGNYLCGKCGRVANEKNNLCSSEKIN